MGNMEIQHSRGADFDTLVKYGEGLKSGKTTTNLGIGQLKKGGSSLKIEGLWERIKVALGIKKENVELRTAVVVSAVKQGINYHKNELETFAETRPKHAEKLRSFELEDRKEYIKPCQEEITLLKKMREDLKSTKVVTDHLVPKEGLDEQISLEDQSFKLNALIKKYDKEIALREEMLTFYGPSDGEKITAFKGKLEEVFNDPHYSPVATARNGVEEIHGLGGLFMEILEHGTYEDLQKAHNLYEEGFEKRYQEDKLATEKVEKETIDEYTKKIEEENAPEKKKELHEKKIAYQINSPKINPYFDESENRPPWIIQASENKLMESAVKWSNDDFDFTPEYWPKPRTEQL